jgi:hypothetical protein
MLSSNAPADETETRPAGQDIVASAHTDPITDFQVVGCKTSLFYADQLCNLHCAIPADEIDNRKETASFEIRVGKLAVGLTKRRTVEMARKAIMATRPISWWPMDTA